MWRSHDHFHARANSRSQLLLQTLLGARFRPFTITGNIDGCSPESLPRVFDGSDPVRTESYAFECMLPAMTKFQCQGIFVLRPLSPALTHDLCPPCQTARLAVLVYIARLGHVPWPQHRGIYHASGSTHLCLYPRLQSYRPKTPQNWWKSGTSGATAKGVFFRHALRHSRMLWMLPHQLYPPDVPCRRTLCHGWPSRATRYCVFDSIPVIVGEEPSTANTA